MLFVVILVINTGIYLFWHGGFSKHNKHLVHVVESFVII